jgi:uncharacterized phage protein (TIGR02218 family)
MAASLSEADLAGGRYDGATIETWLVDWSAPEARVLLDVGAIGEVTRTDHAFTAEMRSLAHSFDETRGRLYQTLCSADLGDARCKADLTGAAMRVTCKALGVESGSMFRLEATGKASGWFSGGTAEFRGRRLGVIRDHAERDGAAFVSLWAPPAWAPNIGEAVTLIVGCDKSFETCRAKFANHLNFRGFPHMPGDDAMLGYVKAGEVGMDGGSLFK